MQERHDTGGVGDEHGDAVCHPHRQRDSLLGCYVSVRLLAAQPSFPPARVHEDASAVNLPDRCQPTSGVRKLALHGGPPAHDFVDGIGAGETEGSGVTGRREGSNPPTLEIWDYLLRNLTRATDGDRRPE